ncbi:MAG TPA: chloride channel protein [Arenicellales bacterium]|nr:chloride channel protein [Arenicellales bacterium]
MSAFAESQRLRMSSMEALPQLALLGLAAGLLTGVVVIGFRAAVEGSQMALLPSGVEDDFESLPPLARFVLIMAGAVVIGAVLQLLKSPPRLGVVHVIERLQYHQGRLPLLASVIQFISAATAIICGHSVGREGPTVHLGAATASLMGQRLGLPNNSIRTLVGCGVAAAIAAGFNTPLAGVIFAMEVVLMEYTITGFIPIILASVSATVLTRAVYGHDAVFTAAQWQWNAVAELPYTLALGIILGCLAGTFSWITSRSARLSGNLPIFVRITSGGLAVALVALLVPEVMGIGYDTVNDALAGEILLGSLIAITAAKLLATSLCIGLGSPGGLIGPTIVIGATAGAMSGAAANALFGAGVSPGFYAMLGMGAMMGAVLQAPLAALLALLELTASPDVIMPGMAAVVTAAIFSSIVMRQPSIYRSIMLSSGLDFRNDPMSQALSRIGVARAMVRRIARAERRLSRAAAEKLLADEPLWILVREQDSPVALLPAADLARHLDELDAEQEPELDLLDIPAERLDLACTDVLASVQDARQVLDQSGKQALYVTGGHGAGRRKIYGVVTREDIDRAYRTS